MAKKTEEDIMLPAYWGFLFCCIMLIVMQGINGQVQGGCKCGYGAVCSNGSCTCPTGLSLHTNGMDCKNITCAANDCLVCSSEKACIRCVNFILASDGSCVERCTGDAEVHTEGPLIGNVCVPSKEDNTKLIIGIVAGVGSGLLLCLLVIIIVCLYIRKTRKNVSLQTHHYKTGHIMETGNIKQYASCDNQAFVGEPISDIKIGVIDPAMYAAQLEQLRPHTETLMQLLAQIRPKLRAMDPMDARVPTYKGVIHQLCRVLVLLHRKETGPSIPSDALGLIEWAQQMLEDHRQQQQEFQQDASPDILGDMTTARISYIDADMDARSLHLQQQSQTVVYAEPVGSIALSQQSSSGVSPYSSVPVPMPAGNLTLPRTFATIHRAPSVPGKMNTNGGRTYSQSTVNRKSSELGNPSNKSIAYFANGRYYDPSPMPSMQIYAPASSYSDRSLTRLSTFVPDRPQSLSSDEVTSDGENVDGEDDSEGDVDVFPFDPKDATDPVEV